MVIAIVLLLILAFVIYKNVKGFRVRSRKRQKALDKTIIYALFMCSLVAVFVTFGVILSLFFESIRFFKLVSWVDFLFGLQWSPHIALRSDQVGSSGYFGFIPLLTGTLMITFIALFFASLFGLFSALYFSEFSSKWFRTIAKPLLEILAGVPTVVYGFFAVLVIAPVVVDIGSDFGIEVSYQSGLVAGLVMGIMIIPFMSSLADDAFRSVPQSLRDAAIALGSTPTEVALKVVFPAALPGVMGAIILAFSRAVGETMIVVMAAGVAANLTANPLEAVTTVTVQIVTLLVGDQEFDSAKTLSAFALGMSLFWITLFLNMIALWMVKRFRQVYD